MRRTRMITRMNIISGSSTRACSRNRPFIGVLRTGVLAITIGGLSFSSAQGPATGEISGDVTADGGVVQAFRVKAKDTVHRIAYTVFTTKGRFHIYNLPAGTYT